MVAPTRRPWHASTGPPWPSRPLPGASWTKVRRPAGALVRGTDRPPLTAIVAMATRRWSGSSMLPSRPAGTTATAMISASSATPRRSLTRGGVVSARALWGGPFHV
jgi:hypothetical protein